MTEADEAAEGRALGVLAGGVSFAQAAAALPDDPAGRAWRAATPALVGLVVLAGRLEEADQEPLGRTRGLALLEQHRAALRRAFPGGLPGEIAALLLEVEQTLG